MDRGIDPFKMTFYFTGQDDLTLKKHDQHYTRSGRMFGHVLHVESKHRYLQLFAICPI